MQYKSAPRPPRVVLYCATEVEPERCGTAGILTQTSRKGVYIPSTFPSLTRWQIQTPQGTYTRACAHIRAYQYLQAV